MNLCRLLPALPVMLAAFSAGADISVTDSTGNTLHLRTHAQRIVSLAPHITEMLYAAGAGTRVVGVVSYSNYPPAALALPVIGSYTNIDMERLIALRPDLILAWHSGNPAAQMERLQRLGLPVFFSEPHHIEDIPAELERIGRLAGTGESARQAAVHFRQQHESLRRRYAGTRQIRVFYELWDPPLMTINGGQIISDVIRLCGGINVFDDLPSLAPTVDMESVLRADPEVIFTGRDQLTPGEWQAQWQRWPQVSAVKHGHLYMVPPDLVQRHTPRLLQGAAQMCEAMQQARRAPGAPEQPGPATDGKKKTNGR
jgi:iron complex transport system substrate-binding protein